MARYKATARRPKAAPPDYDVALDDYIPLEFMERLLSLPALEAGGEGGPPPKRRRLEAGPCSAGSVAKDHLSGPYSAVSVAKGHLSFGRLCSEAAPAKCVTTARRVGRHLRLALRNPHPNRPEPQPDGSLLGRRLALSSPSASAFGRINAVISLRPQDVTESACWILDARAHDEKQAEPGRLWTWADMVVTRERNTVTVEISLELFWNETPSPYLQLRRAVDRKGSQLVIDAFFPRGASADQDAAWSPMDFYDAAHVPPKEGGAAAAIEVPGLEASLFPYQKRTLEWLLAREGMRWVGAQPRLEPLLHDEASVEIDSFRTAVDTNGRVFHVSDLFQTITRDKSLFHQADRAVRGGILAEEMGLGKTMEVIGLMLLHGRPPPPPGQQPAQEPTPGRGTLIVTPEALRQQWMSELARHAPSLRVKHYQGCRKLEASEDQVVSELAGYDAVITTYSVLSAELHFAQEPPQRARRYERAYHRTRSPLVRIEWWRLCLDEAQMIENGYSHAATVARALPRVHSWGITGTPVKDDVKDLLGLLSFLGYQPYCSAPHIWQALISQHKPIFQQIFGNISLRHTKALVRDEITLPPQRRYVIRMPFTAVEEQHYQSLVKEMATECNLDLQGAPVVDEWDPSDYEDVMGVWLNRLRQTTLHPEVGVYSRRLLGSSKARPMRTVDQVLDAMLEQSEGAIRNDERAYLASRLTRGQMYENSPRVREALEIWEGTRSETEQLVSDARRRLTDSIREHGGDEAVKRAEADEMSDSDSEHGEGENKGRIGECRRRLRSALELHHKAVFFCANAYFQIRDKAEMTEAAPGELERLKKLEDDGYEQAKVLRREILRESNRKATRLMNSITRKAATQSFTEIAELVVRPERGIESARVVERLELLYRRLNDQATVLDEWREEVIQLLLRPLVDEDGEVETTGEELADSAKSQDLLMVYYQALRAAIADRQDAISGQTNELVKHETETSIKLAKEGGGPAPEKLLEMLARRAVTKPGLSLGSMRAAIGELRGLQTRLARGAEPTARELAEARIVAAHMSATHAQLTGQTKAALALESEVESFKTAMNTRLEYYRQLQAVSDAVLPYQGPRTEAVVARMVQAEEDLRRKLWSAEAKHRYLVNLKESGSKSNEPRMCVICQMPFATGVLTVCGHEFCKECMTVWFRAHHNCPVCKRGLKPCNLHDITLKPQQLEVTSDGSGRPDAQDAAAAGSPPERRPHGSAIYAEFNQEQLTQIKNIDLDGPSFTTKVDTLLRHLVWLRDSDPGAKSIVFSQYRDFLTVLRNAFRRFHIGHASIDESGGIAKFKEDPAVEVFLLHARAHASGLNLVNASHVFLCEPLLNTALELQAIARVDRIGQQHPTTVWLYLVAGSVEESIHSLSVRRRMEHMGRRRDADADADATPELLDASIEAANTLELEHAALSRLMSRDRSAGELVDKGDLWECLFGHVARRSGGEAAREAPGCGGARPS